MKEDERENAVVRVLLLKIRQVRSIKLNRCIVDRLQSLQEVGRQLQESREWLSWMAAKSDGHADAETSWVRTGTLPQGYSFHYVQMFRVLSLASRDKVKALAQVLSLSAILGSVQPNTLLG